MKNIFTIVVALLITGNLCAQAPNKMSYQALVRDGSNELVTNQPVGMQISILKGSIWGSAVYLETQTPTTNSNGLVSLEIGSGTLVWGDFTTIDWSAGPYFIKTETDPTGGTNYTITGTNQLMSVPYALHANTADSIVGGTSFTEVDGSVTNEIQDLQLIGNMLSLTNNGSATTIDLSPYLDNTNIQLDSTDITNLGFVAGGITAEVDGSVMNEIQDLQLIGNMLSLTNNGSATTIDLSPYLDNTNTQLDSTDIANLGFVAGGITTEVDASVTNEIQQLSVSLSGDTLYLQNGGFVIIPGISFANVKIQVGEGATDIVGNAYQSLIIGAQEWMAENLRTTKYSDGTAIPNVTSNTEWANDTTGAWSHYSNDSQYDTIYGKLYNWYAVETGKLCPTGWHVPTEAEWTLLTDYLAAIGHDENEGTALKATSGWDDFGSESGNGTDAIGWLGLPGGFRDLYGNFGGVGYSGYWWSSSQSDNTAGYAWFLRLLQSTVSVYKHDGSIMEGGSSVRCLKD